MMRPPSQWEIKTLYLQEMFARGILILGTHNMSFSHGDNDVARLLLQSMMRCCLF